MSTYLIAEAAVLALVQSFQSGTVFDAANSSRDDWQVMDAATSNLSAVVEMSGDTIEADRMDGYGGQGSYQERHEIRITLSLKIGTMESGISALAAQLKSTTEALKDWIRPHDRLDDAPSVRFVRPVRTSPVYERTLQMKGGSTITHVVQHITLHVWCESTYPEPNEGGG